MKRIFQRDEKVTLEHDGQRVDAEVSLISPNQAAIAFTIDDLIAVQDNSGGMTLTRAIAVMQDDNGRLTDLFGNEWRIVWRIV